MRGEHDCHPLEQPHYYNYGFSKRMIKMCSDCIISQDIEIVLMTNQMFQGALVISCIKVELAMPHQITPFCICSHVRLSNVLFVLVD